MYKETVGDAPYRAHVCSDDVPDSVSISKCSRSEVVGLVVLVVVVLSEVFEIILQWL